MARMNWTKTLLVLAGLGAVSCDEAFGPGDSQAIHGTNDLTPVNEDLSNLPEVFHRVAKAIGTLTRGCTLTHLGSGIAITAGHCFINLSDCKDQPIFWSFRGSGRTTEVASRCQEILDHRNDATADYAVVRVEPVPPGKAAVEWDPEFHSGSRVSLLGHPFARPLEWSRYCTLTLEMNGVSAGSQRFFHQCDTQNGSSGAPILDAGTGKVIGIHNNAAGGATRIGAIPADTVQLVRELIAHGLPATTRADWYGTTWTDPRGTRWTIASLTAAENDAKELCEGLGKRLPDGGTAEYALESGLNDPEANPQFGFAMAAAGSLWTNSGPLTYAFTEFFKIHHPVVCVD